ncbi:MAG: ATP-binding protein [Pirellulales bacterium]
MSLATTPPATSPDAAGNPSESRTRHLTLLYIIALSVVALLSIAGQLLVQFALSDQLSDSKVINLAGRQRMLSQKLCKAALSLSRAATPQQRQASLLEMEEALDPWTRVHVGLQKGDKELGLPGNNSLSVQTSFARLEPSFQAMKASAERLLKAARAMETPPETLQPLIDATLAPEKQFLSGMNDIVFQLDEEATLRVAQLKSTERILLACTLVVLLLEGFFVFRPAVTQIQEAVQQIHTTNLELQSAKEAAEAANREKSQFLATVSHELRTPLHAILGTSELTQRSTLTPQQQQYLEIITDSSHSLLSLVNDLLDLAKIEAGKLDLHLAPCDICHLAKRVMAMLNTADQEAGATPSPLRLDLQLDSQLEGFWLVDGDRLRQVLTNLVCNAMKFTEAGSITLHLALIPSTESNSSSSRLRVQVIDTGVGIPPESLSRIFLPFTQVDGSHSRKFGGAGLGLAITQRLVELMAGQIGVTSKLGEGSTFWFEIPIATAPAQSPAPASLSSATHPTSSTNPKSLSVLVAEDAPVNRLVLEDMLKLLGHRVILAEDGATALAKLAEHSVDVIILDIHMPDMDGLEVSRRIRAREAEMKLPRRLVFALSAAALPQDRREALAAGMDGYLTKPVTIETLERALLAAPSITTADEVLPTTTPMASTAAIDQLKKRPALFRDLVELFRTEGPSLCQRLKQALDSGSAPEVRLFAHRLKGQASGFSATALTELAHKMEEAACQQDLQTAEALHSETVMAVHQLLAQLQSEVQTLPPST